MFIVTCRVVQAKIIPEDSVFPLGLERRDAELSNKVLVVHQEVEGDPQQARGIERPAYPPPSRFLGSAGS